MNRSSAAEWRQQIERSLKAAAAPRLSLRMPRFLGLAPQAKRYRHSVAEKRNFKSRQRGRDPWRTEMSRESVA